MKLKEAEPNAPEKFPLKPVKITGNRQIAPDVYVLSYQRDFTFIPGQVVALALAPAETPRLYSIASGIHDKKIWLLYNVRPGGSLTPRLSQLKPGDDLYVSVPDGNFYGTAKPSVWIASGTGIAPFVSMWRSGLKKDKMLVHGGRFLHSFYFADQFKDKLAGNYIRCCTRESGEGIYHGRLTQWLREQEKLPPDRKYYLCGSAEMVVDTRDILIEKGVPYRQIMAEIYF